MANEGITGEPAPITTGMSLDREHEKIPFYRRMRVRLLLLITLSVFITEIMVYMPSIASMQQSWLGDHNQSAKAISMILASSPEITLSPNLQKNVLTATDALAISIIRNDERMNLATSPDLKKVNETIDLPD